MGWSDAYLGQGFSAEEQITGKAEFGGIQIIVYPMKARNFERFIEEESLAKIHALEAIIGLTQQSV